MKINGGGKYYDRTTLHFVKNNILKIREIYELEVAKVMFRITHLKKFFFIIIVTHKKATVS